jgi:hypothetical protein
MLQNWAIWATDLNISPSLESTAFSSCPYLNSKYTCFIMPVNIEGMFFFTCLLPALTLETAYWHVQILHIFVCGCLTELEQNKSSLEAL